MGRIADFDFNWKINFSIISNSQKWNKRLEKVLTTLTNCISWSITFILCLLAFSIFAVIAIELIKGTVGWIIGGMIIAYGLYFGVQTANLIVKMGFVEFYSRVSATP